MSASTLGYATLGVTGFEGRVEYGAIGSVVNLASRLCDEAGPGEVYVSQAVRAEVGDGVATAPLGDLVLKGFPVPVAAWKIVAGEVADVDVSPVLVAPAADDESAENIFRARDTSGISVTTT